MIIRSCAIRGRSEGDWHTSKHRQTLELNGDIANSVTSVSKDSLVMMVYNKDVKCKLVLGSWEAGLSKGQDTRVFDPNGIAPTLDRQCSRRPLIIIYETTKTL